MSSTTVSSSSSNGQTDSRSAASRPLFTDTASTKIEGASSVPRFGSQDAFRVVAARSGDHHNVHRLLLSVLHQPSATEFQAQQEDPFYEPSDRLLVKRGDQIVAHLRLWHREMCFGGDSTQPITVLSDFVVLPEYRHEDCESELLREADRAMRANGTRIAFHLTDSPEVFRFQGWTVGCRHSYSVAGSREILSTLHQLRDLAPPRISDDAPLSIRMWRHVEQAALIRLYSAQTREAFGPLVRGESYWRWLISRRAYDRIYVAIEGPDKLELDDSLAPIVGYAFMREGRILELVSLPGHPRAGAALLARACGDAIEHDLHHVRLDAAPDHPLHNVLEQAGGRRCRYEVDAGQVHLVKLLDPIRFLRGRLSAMHLAAKSMQLDLPSELGLLVEGERLLLSLRARGAHLHEGKLGRSYLECTRADLSRMLLGHVDVSQEVHAGHISASTRLATEIARAIFPLLPLWRSPLDEQRA